jgi:hypothetical protein
MAASRCSGVGALVVAGAAEMGAGGGAKLATGAGVTDSVTGGGVAALPKCCFKKKAAPKASNASNSSAKTNFGLMILFKAGPGINKKSKTGNTCLGFVLQKWN